MHPLNTVSLATLPDGNSDIHFKTQFNRFANAPIQLIEGLRLRMATRERRQGGDIEAFFVPLDKDLKFALQSSSAWSRFPHSSGAQSVAVHGKISNVFYGTRNGVQMGSKIGEIDVIFSVRGIPTYVAEVVHQGLHRHSLLRAMNRTMLLNKAEMQALLWDETWKKRHEVECRIQSVFEQKEGRRLRIEAQKAEASEKTAEAQASLDALRTLLVTGLELDPSLDWEGLKDKTPFPVPRPVKPKKPVLPEDPKHPPQPIPEEFPREPRIADYPPKLSLIDKIIRSRKKQKTDEANSRFQSEMRHWREQCELLASSYSVQLAEWQELCKSANEHHQATIDAINAAGTDLMRQHEAAVEVWKAEQRTFRNAQAKQHERIDELKVQYEAKTPAAVIEYCERVLSQSDYPSCVPRDFDFDLFPDTGILVLNCKLPAPEDLPSLSEVKYIQSADELRDVFLSESQRAKLYDDVIYAITLRTLHEIFQSDYVHSISAVVFNGIVTSTDKSTGHEATSCILSIQASRDSFLPINLSKVDPKACFRQLKGVGSSKMHSITPVAPILELKRDDRRFVPSYGVAEHLAEGYNLATMDWEDFEHLVREIFGKEFSSGGGEVKVTQASRDGGVDAVAFDPDPIRGGKIVIQAKRYMHTVGVSAVRDLYGTVLNEGASKGILVTTSDYGPDAYQFASGKPITLLSGANLMHLLTKHGVKAHIDLNDARKQAQDRSTRTAG